MIAAAAAAPSQIATVAALIQALGGLDATATALQATKGTVQQWKFRRRIPARLYLSHLSILESLDIDASPALWGLQGTSGAAAR